MSNTHRPYTIVLLVLGVLVLLYLLAAGWHPADPRTFESSVRIAIDSVILKAAPSPSATLSGSGTPRPPQLRRIATRFRTR